MTTGSSIGEDTLVYHDLADLAGITIIHIDSEGFIEQASLGLEELGINLSDFLISPHVGDLADPRHAPAVRDYCASALEGMFWGDSIEFKLRSTAQWPDGFDALGSTGPIEQERWFALSLRPLPLGDEAPDGAFGILRSIERCRQLETHLRETETTDQLTGLANRQTLSETLEQLGRFNTPGAVALLDIKNFRGLSMVHGADAADEMIIAFAEFLQVMVREGYLLARLHRDRFAIVMPGDDARELRSYVQDIVSTFTQLSKDTLGTGPTIAANAGLAELSGSPNEILARAERALILANATGEARAVQYSQSHAQSPWLTAPSAV